MSRAATPALVRLPVWRARFVLAAFLAGFALMVGRSVYLQALKTGFLREMGEARYSRVLEIPATRGRILDRNGEPLAVSTPVKSVWAVPGDVHASPEQLQHLARTLGLGLRELKKRLADTSHDFVYLMRQIPPAQAKRVAELDIPGIYQDQEYRRYYPAGEVTAQLVGFTDVDDAGQDGIELSYQSRLAGRPGSRRVIRDRLGHIVEDVGSVRAARDGKDVTLSIDGKIQSLAFSALEQAVERNKAKAGSVVVLDVRTGEVLALANMPSYNPNNRAQLVGRELRNRALTDAFEPGSTLKPFTIATALELGKITPLTRIDTDGGQIRMARYTIRDAEPDGVLSVTQVIQRSSNVGAAKIALTLPPVAMWDTFRRVGLGAPPPLDFPGETAGIVRPYRSWRPIEQATMAYGNGISVSLMQLARAYSIFARNGKLIPITLLRTATPVTGTQVIPARVAHEVRDMLETVVEPGGTGPRARIMGWTVAGKTGTAHIAENGGYAAHKYIASFVGFAPASAPRLIVAVMIDQPGGKDYYGGLVAAPVFAQVMQGALRMLNVPHDAPLVPIEPVPAEDSKEDA
ncbi:MAG TPA: penicillin-binding protein 2 [Burkholderiales bacterium]|nr:penicillin-binding protein 2 [Burkholderiales bacterium]